MLSRGNTGDRLAEVDEVLGCLVVQTVNDDDDDDDDDDDSAVKLGFSKL